MNNTEQVKAEQAKATQVRIVSESEHAKLKAAPLTSAKLKEQLPVIQSVVIVFPDGDEVLVFVRRLNNVELFANLGAYSLIKSDGKIDTDTPIDELRLQDVKLMQESLVAALVDAEVDDDGNYTPTDTPLFKYAEAEGDGYPVEALSQELLKLYYAAFTAVNAPEEGQEIYNRFHTADTIGEGETANTDESEAGGTHGAEILHTDNEGRGDTDLSESGVSD